MITLVTIVVDDYDRAIRWYRDILGFELVEDTPSVTTAGAPKRWVVVRPPDGGTGILLARAEGPTQEAVIGKQMANRVGFFLRVEEFDSTYARMLRARVEFEADPRVESYGRVVVFRDLYGNRWDLLGPAVSSG